MDLTGESFQLELQVQTTSIKEVPLFIAEFSNAFLIAFLVFLIDLSEIFKIAGKSGQNQHGKSNH